MSRDWWTASQDRPNGIANPSSTASNGGEGREDFLPADYWYSYAERLALGDTGPSEIHNFASSPFAVARRHQHERPRHPLQQLLRGTPKYAEEQLQQYVTRHKAQWQKTCEHLRADRARTYQAVGSNEIRILELYPGQFYQPIQGRLHHADIGFEYETVHQFTYRTDHALSLAEGQPMCYTALSYVWGEPVFDESITLGGYHTVKITKALAAALRYLRDETEPVMLWVDQICINQGDIQEKERQVLIMGRVFERAWNTVIWLGDTPDRGAFKSFELIDGGTNLGGDSLSEEEQNSLRSHFQREPGMLQALFDIFSNPWFRRTWTIQEAVLSKQTYLMLGASVVAWNDFANCTVFRDLGTFDGKTRDSEDASRGLEAAVHLSLLQTSLATSQGQSSLIHVLVNTRFAAVTEPVDKVYGVLGMSRSNIIPDYSKSAMDVFWECTVEAIRDEHANARTKSVSLSEPVFPSAYCDIFCCVDHDPEDSPTTPSWTPDWSRPRLTTSLGYLKRWSQVYQAGGSFLPRYDMEISDDNLSIRVYALIIDTVHELSPIITEANLSADNPKDKNMSLWRCIEFARLRSRSMFLPFCETLVAGKDPSGLDGCGDSACGDQFIEVLSLLCDKTTGESPTFDDQLYSSRQRKGYFTLEHLKKREPGRAFQGLRKAYKAAVLNRRLCWTQEGRLSLVPRFSHPGDAVVLIPGCAVPFIVRKRAGADYVLIGECYVYGAMSGTLMKDVPDSLSVLRLR